MGWYAKKLGGYSRTSDEAIANAKAAYDVLYGQGWTLNAFSGFWGNVGYESAYNPWRWESDIPLDHDDIATIESSTIHGYGLGQFTPSGKYILHAQSYRGYSPNYADRIGSPNDGMAQCYFIDAEADYIPTGRYPITYANYKVSEDYPEVLASTWLYNYERPADPSATESLRQSEARYWFEALGGYMPVPPTPVQKKKFPIWLAQRIL